MRVWHVLNKDYSWSRDDSAKTTVVVAETVEKAIEGAKIQRWKDSRVKPVILGVERGIEVHRVQR